MYRDASSGDVFHCVAIAVHDGCVRLCRHAVLLLRMGEELLYKFAIQCPRGDDSSSGDQYDDILVYMNIAEHRQRR